MNGKYNVVDEFLSQEEHDIITSITLKNRYLPLFYKDTVSTSTSNDGFYFTHTFFTQEDGVNSDYFAAIEDIFLKKLNPRTLLRVQYNFYVGTPEIKTHGWHVDYARKHKGFLYYLNTNDGQTHIQLNETDAVGVRSIERRGLFFDASNPHRSTTCSDKEFRANIIFNYHD